MRRRLGALGAGLGLALLSGCTPAQLPLAAVWIGPDGRPVAELRMCAPEHQAARVSLGSWPTQNTDGDASTSEIPDPLPSGWSSRRPERLDRMVFPLFSPSSDWQVDAEGIQELRPGRTYALDYFGPRGSDTYDGVVYFTSEDLANLRPDEVWADSRAMSRESFDDLVDDAC
ncbi:hypothetical protein [Streptomyces sp. NPDC048623]|uniref:hypothetical protein n=1 Tax=Streptomyces sp. NPDC048623 TaxID=3155761 RepID=UPI003428E57B